MRRSSLQKRKKHTIKVIVDRIAIDEQNHERLASDVEKALNESFGEVEIERSQMLTSLA